jgi:hypothetical protein
MSDALSSDYVVKLPNGDVRVMSSDELDEAFERGLVKERTPVLAPGGSSWTTIAKLGGFETDEFSPVAPPVAPPADEHAGYHHPTSLSPVAFAPPSPPSPWPTSDDRDELTFHIERRTKPGLYLGLGLGALVLLIGVGVGAVRVGERIAHRAPVVAVEAAPPPPAPIAPPVVATAAPTAPAAPAAPAPAAEASPPTISVTALPTATAPRTKKRAR